MTTSGFWNDVLEPDEKLLWAGRPKPRLHWRNWRLYAPAPLAATGLLAAAWYIIFTTGSEGDMWLLILPALAGSHPCARDVATAKDVRSHALCIDG